MTPPLKAMVLAAGLGIRLRPLTDTLPKPAVPICGIPPIRWTLANLAAHGVKQVVVNTHFQPDAIRAAVGDPAQLGLEVEFSHEAQILGTGGGLKRVESYFVGGTFLMVNAKLLFDADVNAAVRFHREKNAVATMVLRPHPPGAGYGSVDIDEEGQIRRLVGQFEWDAPLTECMFTGMHVLEPAILERLPTGIDVGINKKVYPELIEEGAGAYGHIQAEAYWAEPSTPDRYLAVVCDVLAGRVSLGRFRSAGVDPFASCEVRGERMFVHPDAEVHPSVKLTGPVWIGAGACVAAGAELGPEVAVEPGAIVGSAKIVRSVVWPDTEVASGEYLDQTVAAGVERVASGQDSR